MKIVILKYSLILLSLASCLFATKLFLSNRNEIRLGMMAESFSFASNSTNSTASSNSTGTPAASNSTGTPAASNSTGAASNSTGGAAGSGTGVFQGKTNSSNALGFVGPTNFSISQAPYVVKSCDQVLLIPAQRIVDYKDYCKKQDGFFTMSVYMVNLFEAKDSNKLLESITMDKLNQVPTALDGAPGCIDFRGTEKRISVCVGKDELVSELIEAYKAFMRCRMGDNLANLSWDDIRNIIQSACLGQTTKFNSTMLAKFKAMNITLGGKNNNHGANNSTGGSGPNMTNINPYYADLRVPGS